MENQNLSRYYDVILNNNLYSNKSRLEFKLRNVTKGLDFKGKKVLDIGGGYGLLSFYAVAMGAKKVVLLEPEDDGSSSNLMESFIKVKEELNLGDEIEFIPKLFQEYNPDFDFDIIMLHNSVNHLNEDACITLRTSEDSRNKYIEMFKELYRLGSNDSQLLICDCARSNFFDTMNIRNPFVPTIEWEKHQNPKVWIELLKQVGFSDPKVHWSTPNRYGEIGKFLLSNRIMSYFTTSHFCFKIRKKAN